MKILYFIFKDSRKVKYPFLAFSQKQDKIPCSPVNPLIQVLNNAVYNRRMYFEGLYKISITWKGGLGALLDKEIIYKIKFPWFIRHGNTTSYDFNCDRNNKSNICFKEYSAILLCSVMIYSCTWQCFHPHCISAAYSSYYDLTRQYTSYYIVHAHILKLCIQGVPK